MGVMDRYNKKKKGSSDNNTSKLGVQERYELNKLIGDTDFEVNQDFIDTFISDAKNYFDTAESDYGSLGWSTASSSYDSRNSKWLDLYARSSAIRKWLDSNKSNFDDETYKSFSDALDSYSNGAYSVVNTFKSAKDFYSQFDTEDEYKSYAEYKSEQDRLKELAKTEQATQGWQKYLDDQAKAEQAKAEAIKEEKWWEKLGRWYGTTSSDTSLPLHTTAQTTHDLRNPELDVDRKPRTNWTEEQRQIYGYLYLTEGEGSATAYAYETNRHNAMLAEEEALKQIMASATSSGWGGALNTLGAIATAPFAMADFLDMLVKGNAGKDPLEVDGNISPWEYSQAVTGGISSHLNTQYGTIDERIPIIGGTGWGDVYGLGVSIAQSAVSGATMGAGGTLISYFGQGAASGMKDALERGAEDWQAALYGVALGAFEGIAESIGVDRLFKIGSSNTVKGLLKNIVKQAGAEGVEEGLTSFLGNIADNLIMQDQSNFYAMVEMYKSQGMTEDEAKKKAWMDSVEGIAYDALGGFVSGGVHGGVATSIQTGISNHNASKLYGNQSQMLVDEALGSQFSDVKAVGQKFKDKLDGGKKLSGWNLNELLEVTDNSKLKSAILQRLGELGETSDVTAVADVLVRQAMGEELSSKDVNILNNSEAGHTVLAEMNKDNIKSGGLGNKWAENIGTRRIAPDVYNKPLYDYANAVSGVREAVEKGSVAKTLAESETATGAKIEASESGKTVYYDAETDSYNDVNVKNIVSTKGGIKVELDNGKTVSAKDLRFGTKEEGLMYEMVARMEVTPETANELISTFKPKDVKQASMYFTAVPLAYQYGKMNYEAGLKNIALSEDQNRIAFNRGRMDAMTEAKDNTKVTTSKKAKVEASTNKNGIIFENGYEYDEATANDLQKQSMIGIEVMAKMSNLELHVFESKVVNGKRVAYVNGKLVKAPNGYFTDGNKIYIDINAGNGGEGAMLYTMSHEVTHYIRKWNAKGFKELGDFLIAEYGKQGVPVNALLEAQKDKIKKRYKEEKKTLPSDAKLADMAYEELVADAMSDMFTDPKAFEKLAKLKQKNRTLWEKLGEAIKALLDKLKTALGIYKSKDPAVAKEAMLVREFSAEAYNKLQDLYLKAFVEADTNYEASIGSRNLNDFADAKNENGEPLFQYRAMEADEDTYRDMLHRWGKMTDVQIDNLFATIDTAMELIKDNLEVLDYAWEADIDDRAFSPVKPNSDKLYQVSLDFSTLCRKRILQQTVQAQLQDALNKPLSREEGIAIRDALMALQEEGRQIEVACALCYVESARMKSPEQIKKFINNKEKVIKDFFANKSGGNIKDKIKQAEADARARLGVGNASLKSIPGKVAQEIRDAKKAAKESYKPTAEEQKLIEIAKGMTVSDFTSPEGLENLAKKYPRLFDAYTSYIRNATKSKGIENDTWWRAGDSMKIGDVLIANMNKENGLRTQSWSDFQVIHILDYIASTIELATRNTKAQAYSKVPDYVELMGSTGVLINMSLIPTATFNGSLDYDSVEGIDYKRALELRDKYHATAGTICIGVDNVQIKLLLADATIDYVIPYHRSGMSKALRKLMHIPTWSDYELYQSESNLSRADAEKQAKKYGVKLLDATDPNYQKGTSFSEWFDIKEAQQIAKMENANPSDKAKQKKYGVMYGGYMAMQNAANNYLKLCAERGLAPKFSHEKADFTAEENYWKLLIDRKMVDNVTGEVIEQQTIKPIFNEGEIMRILNDELARYPKVKEDQDYAIRRVTEKMLSGEIKGGMSAEDIAKVMKKPVDNVTNVNILASARDIKPFDSSEERIAQNIKDIAKMSSVYAVDKSKLEKTGKRPFDIFEEHFANWGNHIYSDDLGDITVERSSIKSEIRHGLTAEKIASIEAIPAVIKDGKIIFVGQKSESGLQRIVVCAPIKIGDTPYYMGVMLQRDVKTQRLYLHNVVIEKEASEITQDDLLTTGSHESNEYLFVTSILQKALAVKYQNEEFDKSEFSEDTEMHSDRDSEGNELSAEQQEYFKDSKVRDKNGNLMVVYHGSPSEFTIFKQSKIGAHGNAHGRGFYFTEDEGLASSFYREGGQLLKGYLDIKNPMSEEKLTIKKSALAKLIKALCEEEAKNLVENDSYGSIREALPDTFISNYVYTYGMSIADAYREVTDMVYSSCDNDVDIIAELYNAGARGLALEKAYEVLGYDGAIYTHPDGVHEYVSFVSSQFKSITNKTPTSDPDIRFSDRDSYAPTFYSHMGKVVDGIKLDKMGANGVVPYLKGKGVKDEEIKWSGIEAFLEGKKSVTKAELQQFIAGSQLVIEEENSADTDTGIKLIPDSKTGDLLLYIDGNLEDAFFKNEDGVLESRETDYLFSNERMLLEAYEEDYGRKVTRWSQYQIGGGANYREIVFKMPNSTYSNRAMRGHWGQDAEGVLAHARIQDFTVNGKKMLFVEEIQSDWHNEGHSKGYSTKEYEDAVESQDKLYNEYKKFDLAFHKYVRSNEFMTDPEDVRKKKHDWLRGKVETAQKKHIDAEKAVNSLKQKGMGDVPDAPFRNNYHEYVLKRLLRMAAEEGYDSIGWTIADTQSKRWSYDYEKAYKIEYDQDIPKFLRKYGKKWGATVEKIDIVEGKNLAELESDLLQMEAQADGADGAERRLLENNIAIYKDRIDNLKVGVGTDVVWSMDIPDSMTESVLYEGQVMYSDRVTDQDTLDFLENQEHITTYKSFVEIDGKLYSPMATKVKGDDGKYHLTKPSEIGVWQQAEEKPDSIPKFHKTKGYGYYVLKKDDGGSVTAAYNPYEHSSNLVLNDQFESAYQRPNLVTVECVIPKSEMTSGYKAKYAKDSTGYLDWKSGTVAGKLKGNKRKVYLSRWLKPVRILSDAEVASMYKDILGSNVSVPFNVVTPQLRAELEKVGVKVDYEGSPGYQYRQNKKATETDIKLSERDPDAVSNRTLLANALESAVQNDIEKNKLAQYKAKIALIESEQAKLTEIRAKIKELSFAKGARDTETISRLRFEENEIANRINTYDKQLLNLESTSALKGVLEREKTMLRKRLEQKGKDAVKEQRQKDMVTIREIMTRHTESRKKAIEGRHKTEMRHKIKNVVSDLNKLLLHPTKDQHVPIGLQKVVADALEAINMDTMNAEERVAYYNDLISKSTNPDEIAELTRKRDFFAYRDMNFKDKITALKNAYAEFKESEDPLIRNAHNDAIEDLIRNTADAVGNKSLKDMSYEQLEAVYDMYKAILATVRNSNKMFKEARQATVTENSESVKTEVKEVGGHKDRVLKLTKFFKRFGWSMLKPITAMKVIGSKTFAKLFDNVRAGEDAWAVDVAEAKQFYDEISSKYGYKKWDFKTQHTFKDSAENEFTLSLEQIMSLYAYSKREQADQHLEFGGFIFDDAIEVTEKGKLGIPLKYEVNDANPYRLNKVDLLPVLSTLTTEQKGFIDEMQAYLSDVMGAKGNEISLALYDIKLYKEKNYFPLKTARYFREFDPEKAGTPKIKNSGFSKKTVPQAGNPIVLSNFMDVWASHVNDMSMYHAFVLPLEDFMRVYNYSSTAGGYDSVQQYIKNAYGSQANQYIERLMDDLNGGARVDPSADIINKGLSLFKKASVFASASVVVQQPSAIARAFAYINPKYFLTSAGSALNLRKHKSVWAEVKKYAPVAVIKEMGYFDTGMGRSTVEWIKGNKTTKDKMDDALAKAPAMADELSWSYIWLAVKNEVKSTTSLTPGSEEFLKRCGERFTEIITNTQVYDSVLARSGMMRSKDTGMKMATAFMAEPTTTVNMMVDGIIQGKRGNKKFTASTVGAVSASIILNSILVALVYAARDDDEDETYAEKYIGSLTTELIDGFNPLTYIPFVKDIWSIAQGYDVERSDMSVVSNLWESIEGLFNENKSGWEKVADATGAVSSLFGIPLKNILRDAKGMYNLAETITSGTPTTSAGIAEAMGEAVKSSVPLWDRLTESKTNADRLYEAIISGDQNQIDRIKGRFDDDKAVENAMKQGLRENDSRIKEAAKARYEGNIAEYTRIAREIIAEGNFSQDIVVGAINAEISAIKRGEPSVEEPTEDKDEVTSIYSSSDINSAFNNGDTATALDIIDDLIKTKVANGKTEKEAKSSLRSSMTSYWKPLYKSAYQSGDSNEMARIRKILYASGLYGSASEVVKTANTWLKD